jgi:arylsulfatase A-like enzyme
MTGYGDSQRATDCGWLRLVLIGLWLSVLLAAFDVLCGSVLFGGGETSLRMVVVELASSTLVFGVLYAVGVVVMVGVPGGLGLLSPVRTLPWLLLGLTLVVVLGAVHGMLYRQPFVRSLPALHELGRVYIDIPLVALAGMFCLAMGPRLLAGWRAASLELRVLLGLPVVLVAGVLGVRLWGAGDLGGATAGWWGGLLGGTAVVLWMVFRARRPGTLTAGYGLGVSALVVAGLVWAFAPPAGVGDVEVVGAGEPPIRHVILVTSDAMRADALGAYAPQTAPPTPHLERLWRQSVVFESAISPAPWTLPAFASIMTGLSPMVHGAVRLDSRVPDAPRLAGCLAAAGYVTGALGSNPVLRAASNMHQGFTSYDMYPKSFGRSFGAKLIRRALPEEYCPTEATTTHLTDLAIRWIDAHHEGPFFFWLHYFDPHMPLEPPAAYLPDGPAPRRIGNKFHDAVGVRAGHFRPSEEEVAWLRALYDAEVRYVDDQFGRLLAHLEALGIYEEALIIFSSDHGEEFLEHGGFEHGHCVYDEVLRVPLLVKLPRQRKTIWVSRPVSSESIMPTVLELCGVGYDADALSASSLVPLWGGEPERFAGGPIVSTGCSLYEEQTAIRFGELKYIERALTKRQELFNMVADPAERLSLAALQPDAVAEARSLLELHGVRSEEILARLGEQGERVAELDEATLARLRSLGYIE